MQFFHFWLLASVLPEKFSFCPKNNGFVQIRVGAAAPPAPGSYAYGGKSLWGTFFDGRVWPVATCLRPLIVSIHLVINYCIYVLSHTEVP